jgi:hypothetical protein
MAKRTIEIFSAGCAVCDQAISMVHRIACDSCDISVLDMRDAGVASRAEKLAIRSVPAIMVDGELLSCCSGRGVSEEALREAGVGQPLG